MNHIENNLMPTILRPVAPDLIRGRLEAAFIDTSVADWEVLAAGIPAGIEVVLLDGRQDGVLQMAEWARAIRVITPFIFYHMVAAVIFSLEQQG